MRARVGAQALTFLSMLGYAAYEQKKFDPKVRKAVIP
jgi:hypothetical protein